MPSTWQKKVWLRDDSPTDTLASTYLAMWHQERLPQQHVAWLHITVCHVVLVMQRCQPSQQLVGDAAHCLRRQAIPPTPAWRILKLQVVQWQLESGACAF
jgi:hypothetical protein